jgi:nitrite reductase/ring-hydroxylating ferredoxin subunit
MSATDTTHRRAFVGSRADLPDGTQRIVTVDEDTEIGVIAHAGELYAYRNRCSHQGGPVCEGTIIGLVEPRLSDDGAMLGERFSETEPHLVCPWHGVEFRLLTGECVTIPRARLRRYALEIDDGGDVYVVIA